MFSVGDLVIPTALYIWGNVQRWATPDDDSHKYVGVIGQVEYLYSHKTNDFMIDGRPTECALIKFSFKNAHTDDCVWVIPVSCLELAYPSV